MLRLLFCFLYFALSLRTDHFELLQENDFFTVDTPQQTEALWEQLHAVLKRFHNLPRRPVFDSVIFSPSHLPNKEREAHSLLSLLNQVQNPAIPNVTVIKPQVDHRTYLRVNLENGLKVLLVSDPHATTAGAAMAIDSGAYHDPEDVLGLSHFLEHMLFLGTKKYPTEGAFDSFVSSHGGDFNAYTASEETNFFFFVDAAVFEHALDQFSRFFIDPLLTISAMEREMHAIDSENAKNIINDNFRFAQLVAALVNPEHPGHKFSTGNLQTLQPVPKERLNHLLHDLWSTYYVANNARLVIMGPQKLEELAKFAALWNKMPSKPLPEEDKVLSDPSQYFLETGKMIFYETLEKSHLLKLVWVLPYQNDSYKNKTQEYLFSLLGSEAPQTLIPLLKRKGLIHAAQIGSLIDSEHFRVLCVEFQLAEEAFFYNATHEYGDGGIAGVVEGFFTYLSLVQDRATKETWRYNELKARAETAFNFGPSASNFEFVSQLAASMLEYEDADIFSGGVLLNKFDPIELNALLTLYFTPSKLMLFIGNDRITEISPPLDKTEKWYGTKYYVQDIDPNFASNCMKASTKFRPADYTLSGLSPHALFSTHVDGPTPDSETFLDMVANQELESMTLGDIWSTKLRLPRPNPFRISNNLTSLPPYIESKEALPPLIIAHLDAPEAEARVWWKQESVPNLITQVQFWTGAAMSSAKSQVQTLLYIQMLNFALNELFYDASLAGISMKFGASQSGFSIAIESSSDVDVLKKFLALAFEKMANIASKENVITAKQFDFLKGMAFESVANVKMQAAYTLADSFVASFLTPNPYSLGDTIAAMGVVTLEDVLSWSSTLFQNTACEVFVHGNIHPPQSLELVKAMFSVFDFKSTDITFDQYHPKSIWTLLPRAHAIAPHTVQLNIPLLNTVDKDACMFLHYQAPSPATPSVDSLPPLSPFLRFLKDELSTLYLKTLNLVLKTPVYGQLRTAEQLGYIVWSFPTVVANSKGFTLVIESSSYNATFLKSRAENFLDEFYKKLQTDMDVKMYQRYIDELIESLLGGYETLSAANKFYWSEIVTQQYRFDLLFRHLEVAFLFLKPGSSLPGAPSKPQTYVDNFFHFYQQLFQQSNSTTPKKFDFAFDLPEDISKHIPQTPKGGVRTVTRPPRGPSAPHPDPLPTGTPKPALRSSLPDPTEIPGGHAPTKNPFLVLGGDRHFVLDGWSSSGKFSILLDPPQETPTSQDPDSNSTRFSELSSEYSNHEFQCTAIIKSKNPSSLLLQGGNLRNFVARRERANALFLAPDVDSTSTLTSPINAAPTSIPTNINTTLTLQHLNDCLASFPYLPLFHTIDKDSKE